MIYDVKNGFIVDERTGEVVDRIYDLRDWLYPRFDSVSSKHSFKTAYLIPRSEKRLLKVYYVAVDAARRLQIDSPALRQELKLVLKKSSVIAANLRRSDVGNLATAALYASLRALKVSLSPRRIIDILSADPWRSWKYYNEMKRILGLENNRRQEIMNYIDRIIAGLRYPDMVYYHCLNILQQLDDYYISGRRTEVLAAGIVYAACLMRQAELPYEERIELAAQCSSRKIAEAMGREKAFPEYIRQVARKILQRLGYKIVKEWKYDYVVKAVIR